jgi:hypothetical protein
MRKRFSMPLVLLLALVLAACASAPVVTTPTSGPLVIAKQLATVGPTDTPSDEELAATREVLRQTPTAAPATPVPSITPYIGVFIGQSENTLRPRPLVDPALIGIPEDRVRQETIEFICEQPVDAAFGSTWQEDPRAVNGLRCPIQEMFGFNGEVQIFERGAIYHRPETSELWAIEPGTLLELGSHFYVDVPPPVSAEGAAAPEGLLIPQGVFGGAWAGIPQIREALGFATTGVQPNDVNLQRFEGGTLFLDLTAGQVFALLVNGEVHGPYVP